MVDVAHAKLSLPYTEIYSIISKGYHRNPNMQDYFCELNTRMSETVQNSCKPNLAVAFSVLQ